MHTRRGQCLYQFDDVANSLTLALLSSFLGVKSICFVVFEGDFFVCVQIGWLQYLENALRNHCVA